VRLLIVLPALNEEEAIAGVIESCLAARASICADSPVDEVAICVVSDGSEDRTVELARSYEPEIQLIVFPENRGYGAAIKEAFARSEAELLAFMDADGTCDPQVFAALASALIETKADLSLGCRMSPGNRMPALRRLGNRIFATLLSLVSASRVRDVASGMRVIRRSSLPKLLPLPDGLHFTPAMSARATLRAGLSIAEIDMPYRERSGRSKLHVIHDGLRFLRVILETAFLYRPGRILGFFALCLFAAASLVMINPVLFYAANRRVHEWMIDRFVIGHLLGTMSVLCCAAAFLAQRIVDTALSDARSDPGAESIVIWLFRGPLLWPLTVACFLIGGLLVRSSFVGLIRSGVTFDHWSRYIAMSFFVSTGLILVLARVVDFTLGLVAARLHERAQSIGPEAARAG